MQLLGLSERLLFWGNRLFGYQLNIIAMAKLVLNLGNPGELAVVSSGFIRVELEVYVLMVDTEFGSHCASWEVTHDTGWLISFMRLVVDCCWKLLLPCQATYLGNMISLEEFSNECELLINC